MNVFKSLRLSLATDTKKEPTQSELFELFKSVYPAGSQGSISKLESGNKEPSIDELKAYSKFFNVSTDYLLGLEAISSKDTTIVDMAHKTHLSETAINNIVYEGSVSGDNARVVMLDWILSDREVFTKLMDCMLDLCYPKTIAIDRVNTPAALLDKSNEDFICLPPEIVMKIVDDIPEQLYQKMKQIVGMFIDSISERKCPAPNEFNPIATYEKPVLYKEYRRKKKGGGARD